MRSMFCLTLALVATSSIAAEVYRSVAVDGTVIYSDRPFGRNSEAIFIATTEPASRPPAPVPPAAPESSAAATTSEQQPREPTAAERAEDRAKNCATARDRVERYDISHRLYRTLPNGEREYLDDAEIDDAKARAAADVENWCD